MDKQHNHYLIVIDDKSSDETPQEMRIITREKRNVIYIRHRINVNITAAWNVAVDYAIRKLQADYVLLSNNDVLFAKDSIPRLLSDMKQHKWIRMLGPLTNAPGHQPSQQIGKYVPGYQISDAENDVESTSRYIKDLGIESIGFVNGYCMMFRRSTLLDNCFEHIGPFRNYFDPSFVSYGNENEFQKRMENKGIALAKNSFVFHYKNISMKNEHRFKNHLYYRPDNAVSATDT